MRSYQCSHVRLINRSPSFPPDELVLFRILIAYTHFSGSVHRVCEAPAVDSRMVAGHGGSAGTGQFLSLATMEDIVKK